MSSKLLFAQYQLFAGLAFRSLQTTRFLARRLSNSTKAKSGKRLSTMKRSAASSSNASKTKKRRVELPEYHTTPSVRTESGDIIWPAPEKQIESAREFILEW